MLSRTAFLKCISLFVMLAAGYLPAQSPYAFTLTLNAETCSKGGMVLEISSTQPADTAQVEFSVGTSTTIVTNTHTTVSLGDMIHGSYFVHLLIKHHQTTAVTLTDTTILKDTTITFFIEKSGCDIYIDKFFTPNGDTHNDILNIANVDKYPDYEFAVFNKWGQRVHHQKGTTFEPWDGKWLGIDLPEGVYYYVFFFDSAKKANCAKGDITIMR